MASISWSRRSGNATVSRPPRIGWNTMFARMGEQAHVEGNKNCGKLLLQWSEWMTCAAYFGTNVGIGEGHERNTAYVSSASVRFYFVHMDVMLWWGGKWWLSSIEGQGYTLKTNELVKATTQSSHKWNTPSPLHCSTTTLPIPQHIDRFHMYHLFCVPKRWQ